MGPSSHAQMYSRLRATAMEHRSPRWLPAGPVSREIDGHVLDRVITFCRACQGELPDQDVQSTWEHFFGTYSGYVRRIIRSVGISGSDMEDCAQEVWIE